VLSFGGPPTFEPSAWEWSFRASPLLRSDPAGAREILTDGLEAHPEPPRRPRFPRSHGRLTPLP
jgi:hypothetical protein